jgi:hypothetical protein
MNGVIQLAQRITTQAELLGSIFIGMKQGETVQKFGNPRIKKGKVL